MRWWPASLVHVPSCVCVCGVHIFDFERLGVCVLTSGTGALAGSRVHIVPKSFLMFSVMKVLDGVVGTSEVTCQISEIGA